MNGDRVYGCVGAVDAAHQLIQLLAVLLVGVDLGPRGNHNLNHAHLVSQPGLPLQQSIHGQHAARQSLGVIEAVHAQDQLAPPAFLSNGLRLGQHRFPVGQPSELGRVDADGEDAHEDFPVPVGQHLAFRFHTQNQQQGPDEMPHVGIGVKSDQVGSQDALQDLTAPGENPEDFRGREGNMQEVSDSGLRKQLAQHGWHQGELVVVDPDQVTASVVLDHDIGKAPVDFPVGSPVSPGVPLKPVGLIVEQRPEHAIGKGLVVSVDLALGQVDRHGPEVRQLLFQIGSLALPARDLAGPTHPQGFPRLVGAAQSGRQAPDRLAHADLAPLRLHGNRQSVGDDQESAHGRVVESRPAVG